MLIDRAGWKMYKTKTHSTVEEGTVGRVLTEHKRGVLLLTNAGELEGVIPRRFVHKTDEFVLPKVGDWVLCSKIDNEDKAVITKVLPRYTTLARKEVGKKIKQQIIAANVDTAFIVMGLDDDYSVPRMERYILLVKDSGARAVIILNKSDKATNLKKQIADVHAIATNASVLAINAKTSDSILAVEAYIKPGETVVFIGSSGVGKSTLVNGLLGHERQLTQEVREKDDKGKHTTTKRETIILPHGGILIDTPGMRELGTLASEESLNENFADIEKLGSQCKFRDCDHEKSSGCAVRAAVNSHTMSKQHYNNFLKLQKEIARLEAFDDERQLQNKKQRDKRQTKALRKRVQSKNRR